MIKKRALTLLEVMIALFLIAIASGIIGIKVVGVLNEKRFRASIDRLYVELESLHRLALSSQVDWIALLRVHEKTFILQKTCPETGKETTVSWGPSCNVLFNDKQVTAFSFRFTSSGKISPAGVLVFSGEKNSVIWTLPNQFSVFETREKK